MNEDMKEEIMGENDPHPIHSLLTSLSASLPPGWSVHHMEANPFAFVLARACFDLDSWTTAWQQTLLLQFKDSNDPENVHPSACDLFRKTTSSFENNDPEFITTFSLTRVAQLVQLMLCLDGTLGSSSASPLDLDKIQSVAEMNNSAIELRHLTASLKCRDCGTKDSTNWVVDVEGTPTCAACRLHRELVAKRNERATKVAAAAAEEGEGIGKEDDAGDQLVVVVGGDENESLTTGTTAAAAAAAAAAAEAEKKQKRRKKFPKKPGRKPKRIYCPLCDNELATKKAYVDHVLLNHGTVQFRCQHPGCEKAYPKKQTLKIHMAQVHKIGETPFECKLCGKCFATVGTLHSHEAAVHSTEIKFHCNFCGRGFTSMGKHNLHVKVKHSSTRPYECEVCKKKFPLRCILKRHTRDSHTNPKPYGCSQCTYACSNQRDVRKHEEAVHQGRRDHVCEACTMQFFNRGGLLRHQRTVHEQRKDFACTFCGKKFAEKRNMESHERIHTGEKKYKCNVGICEYACVDKSNLTKHLRKHASVTSAPLSPSSAAVRTIPAATIPDKTDNYTPNALDEGSAELGTTTTETPKVIIQSGSPLQFVNQQIVIPHDAVVTTTSLPDSREVSGTHVRIHVHGGNEHSSVIQS